MNQTQKSNFFPFSDLSPKILESGLKVGKRKSKMAGKITVFSRPNVWASVCIVDYKFGVQMSPDGIWVTESFFNYK
uniref:Uncharacterized protein n=1 Tax=Romanomermis culicivorax TaxID=13658 RepID=A0A915JP09_ROMCU